MAVKSLKVQAEVFLSFHQYRFIPLLFFSWGSKTLLTASTSFVNASLNVCQVSIGTRMSEIAKMRQKSDKIQIDIYLIQYNMKMTILGKISFKFQFQEYFYVKIAGVNGHNLTLSFYDCFIYKISISSHFSHRILIYIMQSRFCTNLIKKYLILHYV